jgi:hypothetical protein
MSFLKKNIRIQLFNEEGLLSDRMVTQTTEFYAGPKEVHNGEMRIEFTITEQLDAQAASDYLLKLIGQLPIKTIKGVQGRKAGNVNNDDTFSADKDAFIQSLLKEHISNQDNLIKALRDVGFIFLTSDYLKFIIPESYKIKDFYLKNYEWLVKRTKIAKDPKNDKFDPQILLGVKIMGERDDKVVLYTYGEKKARYAIPVPEKKALKMSKTNLIKFPHYMTEEERLKWGFEHRSLFNTPEKKPSKFYNRWVRDVQVGDELAIDWKSRTNEDED